MKKKVNNPDDAIVTRNILKEELVNFRGEIMTDVRGMLHETLDNAMKNASIYYTKENERHMGAYKEELIDEMRGYKDEFSRLKEKVDNL